MIRAIAAVSLCSALALSVIAQTASISGQAEVIDGDTLRIGGARIRLYAIDAPESEQRCDDAQGHPYRCGLLATSVLEQEIAGAPVSCTPMSRV